MGQFSSLAFGINQLTLSYSCLLSWFLQTLLCSSPNCSTSCVGLLCCHGEYVDTYVCKILIVHECHAVGLGIRTI